jgi:hypothetical protein
MAFGSDRSANFVIAAKDAATGPIGDIGKAMGRLKSSAGAAFKAVAAGAAVAATALAGFVVASVKGAIEDQRSTILTTAALKARGFELDRIGPKIEEQIKAFQRFGKTDDDVRAGLEVGSRFFKGQTNLLKANATAAAISSVTGRDMADVMALIGKAANGQTRGLAALIGPIEKNATVTDILKQANEKFLPVAEELADSVSGRLLTSQIVFGEQMDALGARFIPAVTDALGFLATNVLPVTEQLMTTLGDVIFDAGAKLTEKGGFVDSVLAVVGPIGEKLQPRIQELADTVGKLFDAVFKLVGALWDDGEGPLAIAVKSIAGFFTDILLPAIQLVLDIVTLVVNTVTEAIKLLDRLSAKQPGMSAGAAAAAGSTVYGLGTGVGGGAGGGGSSGYPTGPIGANIVIGTQATSSLDLHYGLQTRTNTGQFIPGRN